MIEFVVNRMNNVQSHSNRNEVGLFIIISYFWLRVDLTPSYVTKLYSVAEMARISKGIQWHWDAYVSIKILFSIYVYPLKYSTFTL